MTAAHWGNLRSIAIRFRVANVFCLYASVCFETPGKRKTLQVVKSALFVHNPNHKVDLDAERFCKITKSVV